MKIIAEGVKAEIHPYYPGGFEKPTQFSGQKKKKHSKEKEYEIILDFQHYDCFKWCKVVMKNYVLLCSHTGIDTCRENM